MRNDSDRKEKKPFPATLRARRILPLTRGSGHIDDGMIVVDDHGRIAEIGPSKIIRKSASGSVSDVGEVTLTPGLINSHTHLEMSPAANKTVLGSGFEAWVRSVIALDLTHSTAGDLKPALDQLSGCRTAYVSDVSSRLPELVATELAAHDIDFNLFIEFIGHKKPKGKQLNWPSKLLSRVPSRRVFAAGHALYSTHPLTLQMAKTWGSSNKHPFAIHLAEHTGEVEFLATGRGSFADLLKERLVPASYAPPGVSPVVYANGLGLLDTKTIAVHCVHISRQDMDILARTETNVCLCPRSNSLIGVGRAPWEEMLGAGINLCLGTDSLASNSDLDLWNELQFLLENSSMHIPLEDGLAMVTRNPARALGIEQDFGTLERGKRAAFSILPSKLSERD